MSKNRKPAPPTGKPARSWRTWACYFLFVVFAAELLVTVFRTPADKAFEIKDGALVKKEGELFAVRELAKVPVLINGRTQPLGSLAVNSLIQIRNTQDVPLEGNAGDGSWGPWETLETKGKLFERRWYQFTRHAKKLTPTDWLLEVFCAPEVADTRYIFAANHPELISLMKLGELGVEQSGLHTYRFRDLLPNLEALRDASLVASNTKEELRSPFENAVLKLQTAVVQYLKLKNALHPSDLATVMRVYKGPELDLSILRPADIRGEYESYRAAIEAARAAQSAQNGKPDEAAMDKLIAPIEAAARLYAISGRLEPVYLLPPREGESRGDWHRLPDTLHPADVASIGLHPISLLYADLADARRSGSVAKFNTTVRDMRAKMESDGLKQELSTAQQETFYNDLKPFLRATYMYLLALLLVFVFWMGGQHEWRKGAMSLLILGFVVHLVGLGLRMWLQGRPPVTNLYSSAIFIGFGAALAGIILDAIFRNGIGLVAGALLGLVSLLIAHNLSLSGDTMVMMRAVLDTNVWLATHVVVVTLGYASTFVAGALALLYFILGMFTPRLSQNMSGDFSAPVDDGRNTGKMLAKVVYGIVCFATLFSFVGTVLGGIWADQSWGRFWGWDPKENGAILIVLWNILMLHTKVGGLVRERGFVMLALVGNIVTSWSWFGTNMLGIGLHAYGFMDAAYNWLLFAMGLNLIILSAGTLPLRLWSSFSKAGERSVIPFVVLAGIAALGGWHYFAVDKGDSVMGTKLFKFEVAMLGVCVLVSLLWKPVITFWKRLKAFIRARRQLSVAN